MDSRRRGVLQHEPLRGAQAVHAPCGCVRHLQARVRCRVPRARPLPAHHASACHRLPLTRLDPGRAHPPYASPRGRLVRHARRDRALRAREFLIPLPGALFTAGEGHASEVTGAEVSEVQHFLEANPEYYLRVSGEPPGPGAAQEELEALPPAEWDFTRKSLVAFRDASGAIIGLAEMVANLFAAGVWHIGLFVIATRLHGTGAGQLLYGALGALARSPSCEWIPPRRAQGKK